MAIIFKGKKGVAPVTIEGEPAVVGTRSTCHLVLDDPMAAERHCAFHEEQGQFFVEDLGSSSGTYVNGVSVEGRVAIPKDGKTSVVLGVSRILCEIDAEKGVLTGTLKEQSFFYDKKEDPLRWSRSEVSFGQFRPVRLANWLGLGLVGGVLVLACFDRVEEPLVDPGPLARVHTAAFLTAHAGDDVVQLARSGLDAGACASCHEGWTGTPVARCGTCHGDIVENPTHPPSWEGLSCQPCHVDHRGSDPALLIAVPSEETCGDCHDADRVAALPLGTRSDTPWVKVKYETFPHDKHLTAEARAKGVKNCESCHEPATDVGLADVTGGSPQREYAPVRFEKCQECHGPTVADESLAWPVSWHGAEEDGGSACLQCHQDLHQAPLATVPGVQRENPARVAFRFGLRPRDHHDQFLARGQDCNACHRDGRTQGAPLTERVFFHGLHVSSTAASLEGEGLSELLGQCSACHREVVDGPSSKAQASPHYPGPADPKTACGECHDQSLPEMVKTLTAGLPPLARNRFPHDRHLDRSKPGLERGCVACHELDSDLRSDLLPTTTAEARSCVPCHQQHDALGGGSCDTCHGPGDVVYGKTELMRLWPAPSTFSHRSRGHDGEDCGVCHQGTELATRISEVPIPAEADASCRDCHVRQKARFHWR